MSADAAGGRADHADGNAGSRLHVHGVDRGLQRRPATTLHVNGPKAVCGDLRARGGRAPRTILRWDSQPGHYIGGGRSEVLSPGNSRWTVASMQNGSRVEVRVEGVGPVSAFSWNMRFQAPLGQTLQVGHYAGAEEDPSAGVPGFLIFGNGRACGGGQFTVRELSLGPQDTVLRFAADFVLNCGSLSGSAPLRLTAVQLHHRYPDDDAVGRADVAPLWRDSRRHEDHRANIAADRALDSEPFRRRVDRLRQPTLDPAIAVVRYRVGGWCRCFWACSAGTLRLRPLP